MKFEVLKFWSNNNVIIKNHKITLGETYYIETYNEPISHCIYLDNKFWSNSYFLVNKNCKTSGRLLNLLEDLQ